MPFLVKEQLYAHDKDQTIKGADDWFGEAIARPDLVLLDLRSIVAPGQVTNHTTIFFRNLALNEEQTFSGPEDCTDLECSAFANQAPLLIGGEETVAPAPASAVTPTAVLEEPAVVPAPAVAVSEGEEGAAATEGEEGAAGPEVGDREVDVPDIEESVAEGVVAEGEDNTSGSGVAAVSAVGAAAAVAVAALLM